MKRLACLFLLLPSLALAQDVPLEIKGDVTTVKVDKIVIVKEDLTVVKSFPFTVAAKPGAALYIWT